VLIFAAPHLLIAVAKMGTLDTLANMLPEEIDLPMKG
jgi:hypothetical protein